MALSISDFGDGGPSWFMVISGEYLLNDLPIHLIFFQHTVGKYAQNAYI